MRYYRLPGGELRSSADSLVAMDDDGAAYDLTSVSPDLGSFRALARAANANDESIDAIARKRLDDAARVELDESDRNTLQPVVADEVWAAGVTYRISEEARKAESGKPEVYMDVYDSERPELFLKATPSRTVGPGRISGYVAIRSGTFRNPNSASSSIEARSSATPSATTFPVAISKGKTRCIFRRRRCTTAVVPSGRVSLPARRSRTPTTSKCR